ncbi:MAG: hypothetical protein LAN84_10955 [Acidobacteriia bacterium]|nr:hypothetical protein [Terriglobia bacterium]
MPRMTSRAASLALRLVGLLLAAALFFPAAPLRAQAPEKKVLWKPVEFAILKFDNEPPKSWNAYHADGRRGWILIRLWKRYLLVDLREQQVFDLDPQKFAPVDRFAVTHAKDASLEWPLAELPEKPVEITEWSERDVGPLHRVRFRFGKKGHAVEIQLPQRADGRPVY